MRTAALAVLAAAQLAAAHFGINYPAWRADTLSDEETYSQWEYPCMSSSFSISMARLALPPLLLSPPRYPG